MKNGQARAMVLRWLGKNNWTDWRNGDKNGWTDWRTTTDWNDYWTNITGETATECLDRLLLDQLPEKWRQNNDWTDWNDWSNDDDYYYHLDRLLDRHRRNSSRRGLTLPLI